MFAILKPRAEDLEQIRNILIQWTEKDVADQYVTRISNEMSGKTEFNMQFWVAKESEIPLGVVGLCNPLPSIIPFAKTGRSGEMKILYVDGKERGKGIGKHLVDFVEVEARKQGYTELLVRSAQRYQGTAWRFYEKQGYAKVGVVERSDGTEMMQVFGKQL